MKIVNKLSEYHLQTGVVIVVVTMCIYVISCNVVRRNFFLIGGCFCLYNGNWNLPLRQIGIEGRRYCDKGFKLSPPIFCEFYCFRYS